MAKSKEAADAVFQAAATRAHRDLSKVVAASAHEIAGRAASSSRWRWLAIGVTVSLASFALIANVTLWVSRLADRAGDAAGRLQGYAAARNEVAAASWANTPEGQAAFGLAKAGSIRLLADCSGKGWVRHEDVCYPKPTRKDSRVGGYRRERIPATEKLRTTETIIHRLQRRPAVIPDRAA
jgi:hypothetical protein